MTDIQKNNKKHDFTALREKYEDMYYKSQDINTSAANRYLFWLKYFHAPKKPFEQMSNREFAEWLDQQSDKFCSTATSSFCYYAKYRLDRIEDEEMRPRLLDFVKYELDVLRREQLVRLFFLREILASDSPLQTIYASILVWSNDDFAMNILDVASPSLTNVESISKTDAPLL